MLRNFFKITFRNFKKNKSYVFINLIGLGLSLACCIVGYLNWKFDSNYDKNHVNHERIYKIQSYKSVQGQNVPYGITPIPLGEQIKGNVTGITHSSRFASSGYTIKKDLKVFNQRVGFGEDDYLEMFTFPLKYGTKEALLDKSKILITNQMAEAYFEKSEDPTGELLTLINAEGEEFPMIVGGVFEDIPINSSMTFSALMHYENHFKMSGLENDWRYFNAATFVMTDGRYPQNLLDYINNNFIEVQNKARDNFQLSEYYLEQLTFLGKHAQNIRSNWLNESPPSSAIIGPAIMAVMLLLIACFNFTNTSIAISSKRLKEIGIRKVMGSQRSQLVVQFMGENLLLCLGALAVGLILADMIVPAYSSLWRFIDIQLDLTSDPEIYVFLSSLLILTAIIAGAYPSLYISNYQPVKILRGNIKLGGSSKFSRFLLGTQYLLTAMSLVSAYAFYNNAIYQSNYDLGFSNENLLSIGFSNPSEYEKFRPVVEQTPGIQELAGTYNRIGEWNYSRTLRNGESEVEVSMMEFTNEYFDLMDLEMIEGRFFNEDMPDHERRNSIVVNEQLVKEFAWEDPIGQIVQIDDTTRLSVVGVINDFHDNGFFDGVDPTGIRLADLDRLFYLLVKSSKDPIELYDHLQAEWLKIEPNKPFDAVYDSEVEAANEVNHNVMIIFQFMGLISLVLSTIGLYTLVSLNIIKRVKEIGVRKVLGASVQQIVVLLNAQFFWLLLISAASGTIVSYFSLDILMGSIFDVYQAGTVTIMTFPFALLVITSLIFASGRILITALQNPVKSLRYE